MRILIAFGCLLASFATAQERPNVVLIVADDLGYGEVGCYGQEIIRTPHLDRLAREGMRFTQFYSGQAVCAPARCALMTGQHMGHATIRNNGNPPDRARDDDAGVFPGQHPLPDSAYTMAEAFKARGYATAGYGKWGLGFEGSSGDPLRQGFDDFGGFLCQIHAHNHYPRFLWKSGEKLPMPGNDRTLDGDHYSQDTFIEWGLDFIEEHKDAPFFLYLPFAVPHLSIQVPTESVEPYRATIEEEDYAHKGYLRHPYPRAGYAGMVTHMDAGIGRILERLDALNLEDNTIVIFTSDNGPAFDRLGGSDSEYFDSAAGLRGLKGSLYEGGIRVPLIARWPERIAAGSESALVAAWWDLLPTVCDLIGAPTPDGIDGLSIAPTLLGNSAEQAKHEALYWEFPAYGGQQAVRMGDWKAVRQDILRTGALKTELYNLATDRSEANDVAPEHPDVVKRLEALMRSERVPSDLFPFKGLD